MNRESEPTNPATTTERPTRVLRLLIYDRDSLWRATPKETRESVSSRRLNANEWDINRELDRIDAIIREQRP